MDLLVEAKKEIDSYSKGGPIAFADLIQFAGVTYFGHNFTSTCVILPNWLYFTFVIVKTSFTIVGKVPRSNGHSNKHLKICFQLQQHNQHSS